jgi:hypothetical protein
MRLSLITLCLLLLVADAALGQCGAAHVRPSGGRVGSAPLALGDSVMLGAARELARAGFEVDAKCARNPVDGVELLHERRRAGTLPEIVVMALGTNRPVTDSVIASALRTIGRRRTLMLVTPMRSGRSFQTAPMRRAARRRPGRVTLIDWSSRASRNRHWLAGDGTHLRAGAGVTAYTHILKRAAWSTQRGRFGRR